MNEWIIDFLLDIVCNTVSLLLLAMQAVSLLSALKYIQSTRQPICTEGMIFLTHIIAPMLTQTLALLGAIVRLKFRFSSVSSITGSIPLSLSPFKKSCAY